jgi:DNA-binding response OmpR family regulator
MGDSKPKGPQPARLDDTPARPLPQGPGALAADLLADLKQTEPDLALTEIAPPQVIGATPLDPSAFAMARRPEPETQRIDLPAVEVAIPFADTLPSSRPSIREGGSLQELGPTMISEAEAIAPPPRKLTLPSPEQPPKSGIRGIPLGESAPMAVGSGGSRPAIAPKITQPCSVLVVDDDRRAGAQTAARLMEAGCTCRVVVQDEAGAALAQPFHVVVLDVPAPEARLDSGWSRLQKLGRYTGPIVVSSAAVIDPLPRGVGAGVTKPYFLEDLIGAIETARRKPPPPSASEDEATVRDPVEAIAHHDLDANVVRAMIVRADGQVSRGRIRTMSYDGELLVGVNNPLRKDLDVGVELTLNDGRRLEIKGKVTQATGADMEVVLAMTPEEKAFSGHFLDQARDVTQPFIEQVRIRQLGSVGAADQAQIDQLWRDAKANLSDDAVQQRFIQACLKSQRIEHAVRSYRELKQEDPENERIDKYLQQVGTILGFYAFKKEPEVKDQARLPMSIKVALALFIGAALILWVMLVVMK